jgi:hypothetical protein
VSPNTERASHEYSKWLKHVSKKCTREVPQARGTALQAWTRLPTGLGNRPTASWSNMLGYMSIVGGVVPSPHIKAISADMVAAFHKCATIESSSCETHLYF